MIRKLKLSLLFALILNSFSCIAQKNTGKYIKEANETSLTWLANMNNGDFTKCYEIISKEVKVLYDSLSWCSWAKQITKEFGSLKDRVLVNAEFKSKMRGMEDGFYVIANYEATYENTSIFKESIILKQNDQANWQILDYSYEYQLKKDEEPIIEK